MRVKSQIVHFINAYCFWEHEQLFLYAFLKCMRILVPLNKQLNNRHNINTILLVVTFYVLVSITFSHSTVNKLLCANLSAVKPNFFFRFNRALKKMSSNMVGALMWLNFSWYTHGSITAGELHQFALNAKCWSFGWFWFSLSLWISRYTIKQFLTPEQRNKSGYLDVLTWFCMFLSCAIN